MDLDKMTKTNSNNHLRAALSVAILGFVLTGASVDALGAERKLTFVTRGVVEKIMVKPGDTVEVGQPLASLNAMAAKTHLGVMEATVQESEQAYTLAEKALQRERELFDAISTTSAKVEMAELAMAQADTKLTQAQGRLAMAKMRLGHTTLKAPFAGKVVSVPGFPGQVVNPRAYQETVVVLDDGK